MERTNRIKKFPWALRQYVVYHKYNDNAGPPHSTWAFFGRSQRSEDCVDRHFSNADLLSPYPLGLHIRLLKTAIASWRPYLIYQNEELQRLASRMEIGLQMIERSGLNHEITFVGVNETDEVTITYPFTIDHYQGLTNVEHKASEVLLFLDSTLDTVTSLAPCIKE